MGLELNKLTNSIVELGDNAYQRLKELDGRLPVAHAIFNSLAADQKEIRDSADKIAHKFRWAGAIPSDEPINAKFRLPACPVRFNVIAADGSQIYPDRHNVAIYYLINIGSIVFRHGIDLPPSTNSKPEVFFKDDDLYYEDEASLLTTEMINANRDVRELGELARLAQEESATAPTITLLDNGLLLYITLREQSQKFSNKVIDEYLAHLESIKKSKATVAGVVDRPRSANIVRLLHLSTLLTKKSLDNIAQDDLHNMDEKFKHVTDSALFDYLKPGERSALFVLASPANLERYEPLNHKIYFFFLNTGHVGKDALLRVEVPEWIANDKTKLDLVHTAINEQCKVSNGFPYVLMRAHELAVVTTKERGEFDNMVTGTLIRKGLPASISQKALGKQWTSGSKRRYGR